MCPDSEKEPHGMGQADYARMKVLEMGWKILTHTNTHTYIYTYTHIRQALNSIPKHLFRVFLLSLETRDTKTTK